MKYLAVLMLFSCFVACNSGNPDLENAEAVKDRSEQQIVTGDKPSQNLKANSIPENDLQGQVKWALGRVQEELRKSSANVSTLGDVTVLVDDNFQMVIQNKVDGNVHEQRVGLANLDTDMKKIEIIVDKGEVANPGFRMPVIEGKAGVERYLNGEMKETVPSLELILGERRQVQLVISALTQAINTSKTTF